MSDVTSTIATDPSKITFVATGSSRSGSPTGRDPSAEDHVKANEQLKLLAERGSTKTAMIEYLLSEGWTVSAIAQKIRYETSTTGHDAGDPLKYQHVNAVKLKWLEKQTTVAKQATPAPATTPATSTPNTPKVEEPKQELRKSTSA
jgi:hypothetical protein